MSKKKRNRDTNFDNSASYDAERQAEMEVLQFQLVDEILTKTDDKTEPTPPQQFNIEEMARAYIVGYQGRWLPSLKAHAANHGMKDLHSAEEWKNLFKAWGASLK